MLAFVVGEEAVFTGDTLFTGSVGGTQDAFDDLRRSVMDVLMGLPHELVVYPGHSEETRIGREWDENPFVRVWRGVEAEGEERCHVGGSRRPSWSGATTTTAAARPGCVSATGATPSSAARGSRGRRGLHRLRGDPALRGAHHSAVGAQRRLAEDARRAPLPQMLTGTVEGRLLEFLVIALRPQRVLELGTYSGYSAVSMAGVLPPGGHIDVRGGRDPTAAVARRCLRRRARRSRHDPLGPALETIERLEGEFDLIFIDADKVNYPAYYESLVPRLSAHGLMVLDNTLWSGRVVEPDDSPETQTIAALNDRTPSSRRGRGRAHRS